MSADRAYDQRTEAQWVVRSLENIFRPIVRLLFNRRIGYPTVMAVLRRLYVEQAYEAAAAENPFKQPTVSSVSVSSGVDVREVKQELDVLRERSDSSEDLAWLPTSCAESKILEHWAQKPPFVDDAGKPVELGGFGPGLTFERLVKRVCGNVGPAEIRDRLYKAGCIEIIPEGAAGEYRLRLVQPYYTATSAEEMSIMEIASGTLRHLANTLAHNLAPNITQSFVQQERWTRRLRRGDVAEFRDRMSEWVRSRITESESVMETFEIDPFDQDDHIHAGIGFYYFEEDPGMRNQFQFA